MSTSVPPSAPSGSSTRPYLVRALHEWCTDNGFTPYLAVFVGPGVKVPDEYVKNNEIVLNGSFDATTGMRLGNDAIEFKARFGGIARDIYVPVENVIAIYARENGQGMAFPVPTPADAAPVPKPGAGEAGAERGLRLAPKGPREEPRAESATDDGVPPPDGPAPNKPLLKRIK